ASAWRTSATHRPCARKTRLWFFGVSWPPSVSRAQ
ncbi:hypothetical protein AK812_SmicGene48844, partial [Symbiodinium microadriaticum]